MRPFPFEAHETWRLARRAVRMPVTEAVARSRQACWKLAGRFGLYSGGGPAVDPLSSSRVLVPALLDIHATARAATALDSEATDQLIARADRICNGWFDILGYGSLQFGEPIDWSLDPVHGRSGPAVHFSRIDPLSFERVGDHKIIWELNRHAFLVALAQAYTMTGENRYAECAARFLGRWLDANPPQIGINWVSSLELALRATAWLYVWPIFESSKIFAEPLRQRWMRSLDAHARHIAKFPSTFFAPNTHLLGEALALYLIGLLMYELPDAARYRRMGAKLFGEQIHRQTGSDGFHFEQSSCYHLYMIQFLLTRCLAGALNGWRSVDAEYRMLERAIDALLPLLRPDGMLVNVGDEDGGQLFRFGDRHPLDTRPLLASAAVLLDRPDLKALAGTLPAETIWLLGPAAQTRYDQLTARMPGKPTRRLNESGYCGMRNEWSRNADHLVFDAGPHGSARCRYGHAHSDALSVAIVARGKPFIVDAGTGNYSDGNIRERLRTTTAHNTAWVDDLAHCSPGAAFEWRSTADGRLVRWLASAEFDLAEGFHDGYLGLRNPVVHRRRVLYWKRRGWLLWDRFEGGGDHRITLQFVVPVPPDELVLKDSALTSPLGTIGVSTPETVSSKRIHLRPFRISPRYGRMDTGTAFRVNIEGQLPVDFVTIIRPGSAAPAAKLLRRQPGPRVVAPARNSDESMARHVVDDATGDRIWLTPFGAPESSIGSNGDRDAAAVWSTGNPGHGLIVRGRPIIPGVVSGCSERIGDWAIENGCARPIELRGDWCSE